MTRLRRLSLIVGALAAATSLAACGAKASPSAAERSAAASAPAAADSNTVSKLVTTKSVALGSIVTDDRGFTLYRFEKDSTSPPASNCTGQCAITWPPALTTSGTMGLSGVDNTLIGTITRADGSKQITLAGHPLYHYRQDQAAGDVKGQGVGQTWYAVTPTGEKASTNGAGGANLNAAVSSKLGAIVTDADGFTLYAFKKDTTKPAKSNCTGECAKTWPPAVVTTQDITVSGIEKSLVGTLTRPDGTTQLTLGGNPVYEYKGDKAFGDTNGEGIGGTWYAITPNGQLNTSGTAAPAPGASAPKATY
jgi:predicted lipoprotein with Yx(FWY)xxD motif